MQRIFLCYLRVEDDEVIERIRAPAIPPAWRRVWISEYPNGHIPESARDDVGTGLVVGLEVALWPGHRALGNALGVEGGELHPRVAVFEQNRAAYARRELAVGWSMHTPCWW